MTIKTKILEGCTEESINDFLATLFDQDIVSIKYYPQTANHYKSYCFIVYKT